MIVCHCEDVHERTIKHAINAGACSLDEIADACGAGSNCGGCWPELQKLLAHAERPKHVPRWRRRMATPVATA